MKTYILLLIATTFIMISCNPDKAGLGGTKYIIGKATIPDTLSNYTIPAINADVYVGFGIIPTVEDYSFKTTTNSLGIFTIDHLLKDQNYNLLIIQKARLENFDIEYNGTASLMPSETVNVVNLDKDDNIRKIQGKVQTNDKNSSKKIPVPGAMVYIGYNYIPNSTKYLYKLETDENGEFTTPFLKIEDENSFNIFVIYTKNIDILSNSTTFKVLLSNNNIISLSKESDLIDINGNVKLYDFNRNGDLIAAANTSVYVGNGFIPTVSNYTYSTKTASDGSFTIKNILTVDTVNLSFYFQNNYQLYEKSVLLENQIQFNKPKLTNVILNPKDLPGIISIKVIDLNGTPQPNIQICCFSNSTLSQKYKGCEGSIFSSKTNKFGKVFTNDLQDNGTYFVNGLAIVGQDTLPLKVADKIIVSKTFPQEFTVILK